MSSLSPANRLLQLTTLAGIAVDAQVLQSYMATNKSIQDVLLDYTDEELARYLRNQAVLLSS